MMILRDGPSLNMQDKRQILGIIPARAGSKGIPNKNINNFCEKPLINWTFKAAKDATCFTDVILSSDSQRAIELAREFDIEVPFLRPKDLSEDYTEMRNVILHSLKFLSDAGREYTHVILLQPTSPFRTGKDIDKAWELFSNAKAKTLISVTEAEKYAPNFMYKGDNHSKLQGIPLTSIDGSSLKPVRRQDVDNTWWRNGAVYIFETENLINHNQVIVEPVIGYEMPWYRSINIDEPQDVYFGEFVWRAKLVQLND